ncbi:MAG TPA: type I-E CRISPR-associated protein Cas5/CasD [Planctomycetota bacterium]|nr:type I-E CRISPR-associated protein Cas5/CasD [Planctomycetota bacterium]
MGEPNTLFLRLEGPLQSWGLNSKFVIRRTAEAPTKSGVLGMICCAMGIPRPEARPWLERLNRLAMAVRVDRPGTLWSDYHTVGAGFGLITAEGKLKTGAQGTLVTRRYYLCDASFLVALQAGGEEDEDVFRKVCDALLAPKWQVYLGRKACPPSRPVFPLPQQDETWANPMQCEGSLTDALASLPWEQRYVGEQPDSPLQCLVEWRKSPAQPSAPSDAETWPDAPISFDPPVQRPRLVVRDSLPLASIPLRCPCPASETPFPSRPRAGYGTQNYQDARRERLRGDHHTCVFCKAPCEGKGATAQHITYRYVGTDREKEHLRSLCRLCHDAVTMIEYGFGMGLDRINPEEPRWRNRIIQKRDEIIRFRSLETRRRRLEPEEVE